MGCLFDNFICYFRCIEEKYDAETSRRTARLLISSVLFVLGIASLALGRPVELTCNNPYPRDTLVTQASMMLVLGLFCIVSTVITWIEVLCDYQSWNFLAKFLGFLVILVLLVIPFWNLWGFIVAFSVNIDCIEGDAVYEKVILGIYLASGILALVNINHHSNSFKAQYGEKDCCMI